MTGDAATATVPAEMPGHVDEAGPPADCWKRSGDLEPQVALSRGRRVVVTEFDVEFVDLQFQPPFPRQRMLGPFLISPHPLKTALLVFGLGRRYMPMAEEPQQALASDLYTGLLQDLHSRGLELVPQDVLRASPAYVESRKESVVRSPRLMILNVVGSDTGTVMRTRTVAAPGLCVAEGSPRDLAAAEARILQETRADVALAVRLRVGTFRKHPALEHRSVIRLTTCEGSTTLRACHSLVSDLVVAETSNFRPFVGRIEPVDPGGFSGELTAMLPKFIALALSESKP
jgi:hypothetical protein